MVEISYPALGLCGVVEQADTRSHEVRGVISTVRGLVLAAEFRPVLPIPGVGPPGLQRLAIDGLSVHAQMHCVLAFRHVDSFFETLDSRSVHVAKLLPHVGGSALY